tara:strand:+ start:335 stop:667 length:333 start_codon:yes stop_codon:yes gene_type:complete
MSCSNYENKAYYKIEIGDSLELYYDVNSCCNRCLITKDNAKHLEFINSTAITEQDEDCEGCTSVSAYRFKAFTKGIDTLRIYTVSGGMNCNASINESELYDMELIIVEIE